MVGEKNTSDEFAFLKNIVEETKENKTNDAHFIFKTTNDV